MDDPQRQARYLSRWPRATPAFAAELAAADAVNAALTEQVLDPGPRADRQVAAAEAKLEVARKLYDRACDADEKERWMKRPELDPDAVAVAKVRDEMIDLLEAVSTSAAAWERMGGREENAQRLREVERLASHAARLAEPRDCSECVENR